MELITQVQRYKYHRKAPMEERFWAQVQKSDGCWLWNGTIDKDGYGYICEGGSASKGAKYKRCHRVSWELAYGPVPKGQNVLHTCDNPACVNPEHLFLGTHKANAEDRNAKGRHAHGERHGNSKLNEEKVREIRRRYAVEAVSQMDLAHAYGVNQTIISDVLRRVSWKHVT
jgi:hypothetical protein